MREAPRRLGRGLAALLGQEGEQPASFDAPAGALQDIELDKLVPNPTQPRTDTDPTSLAELAQSIRQQGLLQPLLVRAVDGAAAPFEIVAGERRWRAAREAGLSSVPCLVQQFDDRAASLAALVENLQREDLQVLDEAQGFRRVLDSYGLTQETLALALGKSRSHVTNTLRLLNLPSDARDALRDGRISAGHARALLSHADPGAALAVVLAQGLSVRETESLALDPAGAERSARPPGQRSLHTAQEQPTDVDLEALERRVSEQLGLAVRITARGGRGRLSIAFHNHDQLEGLLQLLAPA